MKRRKKLRGKMAEKTNGIVLFSDLKDRRLRTAYWLVVLLFAVCVLATVFPPVWVILSSFKDRAEFFRIPPTIIPETFHFDQFVKTWNSMNFIIYYRNSLIVVAGSVVCAIFFNGVLAFVLGKVKPFGYKFVRTVVIVSLMIPATTILVPLLTNVNDVRSFFTERLGVPLPTYLPLWLSAGANAFYVMLYLAFFRTIPTSILEAAEIDGCGNGRLFVHMILPLSAPINMVVGIYAVNAAWSDFLYPYLVLFPNDKTFTVMVKLFVSRSSGNLTPDMLMRCVAFAIVPPVIMFAIFQKYIIEGASLSGVKE